MVLATPGRQIRDLGGLYSGPCGFLGIVASAKRMCGSVMVPWPNRNALDLATSRVALRHGSFEFF